MGLGGPGSGAGTSSAASDIAAWVASTYTATTVDGITVYDLTATPAALSTHGRTPGPGPCFGLATCGSTTSSSSDGADDFSSPAKWTAYTSDVWVATSVNWNPGQVFADGVRLTATGSSPSSLGPMTFRYVAGQGLYVRVGNGNPGLHQLGVGRHGSETHREHIGKTPCPHLE